MENPYEENYYQPYRPEDDLDPGFRQPAPPVYDGNSGMATVSLVMGILALVTLCCIPFVTVIFAGLAILFSCLSKGTYSRPGPAKAGMAIGVSLLAILSALVIGVCTIVFTTDKGQSFLRDYLNLITSDHITDQDLYNFIQKYAGDPDSYYNYDFYLDDLSPDEDRQGGSYYDSYDYYNGEPGDNYSPYGGGDDFPEYYFDGEFPEFFDDGQFPGYYDGGDMPGYDNGQEPSGGSNFI